MAARQSFRAEPTESNVKFLYSFIKLLLTNGGAQLEPEDEEVIHKGVQDMYLLDPKTAGWGTCSCPRSSTAISRNGSGRASTATSSTMSKTRCRSPACNVSTSRA
jgi:hypothetical protein